MEAKLSCAVYNRGSLCFLLHWKEPVGGGEFFCSYLFIKYFLEMPWPPHSPDITPIDFSVWGCVKDKVYLTYIQNIEELRHKIIAAFQAIDHHLNITWKEPDYRLQASRAINDEHLAL